MAQGTQQDLMQKQRPASKLLSVSIISDYNQFKNNKFGVCLKGSQQL